MEGQAMHKPSGTFKLDINGKYGKKGSYYVRFKFPDPITGERKEKTKGGLATQAEAKSVLSDLMAENTSGELVIDRGFTVAQAWELYVEELEMRVKLGTIKKKTLDSYATIYELHIRPRWGKRVMAEVRPLDIVRFFKDHERLRRDSNVWHIVRTCFAIAHKNGFLGANPFLRVKRSDVVSEKKIKKAEKFWDVKQLKTFRDAIAKDDHPERWFYEIIIFSGLRRGEAIGICDDSLDFTNPGMPTLTIDRQLTLDISGNPEWDTPKTETSKRTVVLIDEAVTAIREQQFKRATYELEYKDEWTNERGALFVNADGSILNPDTFSKRFSRYVKELGLPNIGLHGLRHTFATVALEAGVPLKALSEMLGHSEVNITADIYQHVTVETKATAFEQVAGLIR
tara:strand:+ start:2968 stop:4161 length:1194 start_codon:yes stop_codon:yes gene_type:complete